MLVAVNSYGFDIFVCLQCQASIFMKSRIKFYFPGKSLNGNFHWLLRDVSVINANIYVEYAYSRTTTTKSSIREKSNFENQPPKTLYAFNSEWNTKILITNLTRHSFRDVQIAKCSSFYSFISEKSHEQFHNISSI